MYLGVFVNKVQYSRCSIHFTPIIVKTKKLNLWLQRTLRTLLTKVDGILRLPYTVLSIHLDNKTSKIIDQMLWRFPLEESHYIRKPVVMNLCEHSGLNFLDFSTLNNTFKINWLKHFLKNRLHYGTSFLTLSSLTLVVLVFF